MSGNNFNNEVKKEEEDHYHQKKKSKKIRKIEMINNINKSSIVLSNEAKKEIEEKRLKFNERHKRTCEKNKEKIKEKALRKYYEKKSLQQNTNSIKRGRPVGSVGKYKKSIVSEINEDSSQYQMRIDILKKK